MKILVTGGAGYIGSHVVKLLGQTGGFDVTVIDNLSTGRKEAVLFGKLVRADLSDFASIEKIIKKGGFDAALHFAASIIVPESVENPLKYYLNNTVNTTNLINLCNKYGVNKFVFSSTAAVYGDAKEVPVKETTPLNPVSPYATSKMMSEIVLMDAAKVNSDFKYAILRYFNVAGADVEGKIGQYFKEATHLIKVASQAALGIREKLEIYGDDYNTPDGTGVRDYIHVDDLANAHLLALKYLAHGGDSDVFNCGYGHGFSVMDVVAAMKKVSGVDFIAQKIARRPGDVAIVVADNAKIVEKLKFKPKYDNLEIICKTALEWEKKLSPGN